MKPWSGSDWPDGWLAQVPVLGERRGSAPATVAALQGGKAGTLEKPTGPSIGAHGLIRSLPAGLCSWWHSPGYLGASMAALTHGGAAVASTALAATMVHLIDLGNTVAGAAMRAHNVPHGSWRGTTADLLAPALAAAEAKPGQVAELARLAPDATAQSALAGGVYVAVSFREREQIKEGLLFAASAGSKHAAAVAGALLGTAHGPEALPVDWLSWLELTWVADTLARDLVTQVSGSPSGANYMKADEPHWRSRYPAADGRRSPVAGRRSPVAGRRWQSSGLVRYVRLVVMSRCAVLIVGATVSYRYGALVSRPQWSVNLMADG